MILLVPRNAESQSLLEDDLQGLAVTNRDGTRFGEVDHVFDTGANDVLVVRGDRERLIPFIREKTVLAVDLERREILVDWDADF